MAMGIIPIFGAWALQSGEAVLPCRGQGTCLSATVTNSNETPIPYDLGPTGIFVHATGQIVVVESPDQFVEKTVKYIKKMAFLPVDEEGEQLIDCMVNRRAESSESHSLTRQL